MRSVTTSSSQAQPVRWDDLVATIDAEDGFRPRDSRVARLAAARILAGRLHRSCSPAPFEGTAALILDSELRIIDRRGHLTVMRDHGFTEALIDVPSGQLGHEWPEHIDLQIDVAAKIGGCTSWRLASADVAADSMRLHDSSGCRPSAARLPNACFTATVVIPGTTDFASRTRVSSPVASTGHGGVVRGELR